MPWKESELQTLSVPILYPLVTNLIWETNVAKFPSQMEMRISYQTIPRYSYVAKTYLNQSQLNSLITLFNNCKGMLIPFKWVLNNETKYVRFNSHILKIDYVNTNYYEVELNLIDVHPSEIIIGE